MILPEEVIIKYRVFLLQQRCRPRKVTPGEDITSPALPPVEVVVFAAASMEATLTEPEYALASVFKIPKKNAAPRIPLVLH